MGLRATLTTHLELGRTSNLPTVVSNILLAIGLSTQLHSIPADQICLLIFAGVLFYCGGMYLNDYFDREWDKQNEKERPIVLGKIAAKKVYIFGSTYIFIGFIILTIVNISTNQILLAYFTPLALVLSIVWYDLDHKARFYAPIIMGCCRAFLILSVASLYGLNSKAFVAAGIYIFYTASLTYVAKFEMTKDESVKTLPKLLYLACIPLCFTFISLSRENILHAVGVLIWSAYTLSFLRKKKIGDFVTRAIAGMILLDSLLLQGEYFFVFLGLFVVTLVWQRYIAGT